MPHLLGDFPTASECSSPIDQHTQVGETSADHMSDLSMPDMGVLLDEFNPEAFPIEPTGPESGRVSFDPPKFPNTSAIANFPELPELDLTGLTEQPEAAHPNEPEIAASYPQPCFPNTRWQLPRRGTMPAPQRQILVPTTRRLHNLLPPRYASTMPRISQALYNWNLIQSTVGVIPCARPLPAGTNPSFLWHAIPHYDKDSYRDPVEDQVPCPSRCRKRRRSISSPPSPADVTMDFHANSGEDSDNITGSKRLHHNLRISPFRRTRHTRKSSEVQQPLNLSRSTHRRKSTCRTLENQ